MRLIANSVNGTYLRAVLDEIRSGGACAGVVAAVAYVGWADDLLDFCRTSSLPLTLFCLCNEEAMPAPAVVERFLDRADRWHLWLTARHFHPKLIWFRDAGLYIGSANLTRPAWYSNVEAGIFLSREEMQREALEPQIASFFEVVRSRSRLVTREDLRAIENIARRRAVLDQELQRLTREFQRTFSLVPGSDSPAVSTQRADPAKIAFVTDWSSGLEILRHAQSSLRDLQASRGRRWVTPATPLAIEVDQALNFFYQQHIRDSGTLAAPRVEELHTQHLGRGADILHEALVEWMDSDIPAWIRDIVVDGSPVVRHRLAEDRIDNLSLDDWTDVCRHTYAIRTTSRQLSNAVLGRPHGTEVDMEQRVRWYAEYTWAQRTQTGRTLIEVLRYLIWNERQPPADRLWNTINTADWKLTHFGISGAGELLGLARPTDFPPRNNRVSRALYAMGFDVVRYGD